MVDRAPGFFDVDDRLAALSAKGDDLGGLKAVVDFEVFRPALEAAVPRSYRSKGGRPPFDRVLMFKVLILQAMHSLSDERCEYLIKDRLSFMRFLRLNLADPVPDANTIWTYREALKKAEAIDGLVPAFRRDASFFEFSGDERADRRRHDCRRAQAAQYDRGKEGNPRRPHSRGLAKEPGAVGTKGSRRTGRSNTPWQSRGETDRCRRSVSPSLPSATRITFRLTGRMG